MVVAADRLMPILQCTRIFDPADLQCSEERRRYIHNALALVWDDWGGYHWFLVNRVQRLSIGWSDHPPACSALLQRSSLVRGEIASD